MIKSPFLETALEAVKAAESIIQHYYHHQPKVSFKQDRTPVTIADIEAEKAIKEILLKRFPDHGFLGEETGETNSQADYQWLIDPIDGTKSFVRGTPFFSTQIALMYQNQLILGVSNAPVFGELAYAEQGHGAWLNGKAMAVSGHQDINQSVLSLGNIATLTRDTQAWQQLGQIIRDVQRIRGYGDFYHYHLLAAGKIDLIIESDVNILDIAALTVIIREAGGHFTNLNGQAINLQTSSALACANSVLHNIILKRLNPSLTTT